MRHGGPECPYGASLRAGYSQLNLENPYRMDDPLNRPVNPARGPGDTPVGGGSRVPSSGQIQGRHASAAQCPCV